MQKSATRRAKINEYHSRNAYKEMGLFVFVIILFSTGKEPKYNLSSHITDGDR